MRETDQDLPIRLAAFKWLEEATAAHGDVLPRRLLEGGFEFDGQHVTLIGPQGIWKPRQMTLPLSITTTPGGPYNDAFGPDNLLAYRYRGTDPLHPDNQGLRRLMALQRPLIYFHGIVTGKYLAVWPVYIAGDDQAGLTFRVAVDDPSVMAQPMERALEDERAIVRRAYMTAQVRVRLHQRSFRERVIEAYRSQCALCRLKHEELLDAAHIIPDSAPAGEPSVTNGIALWKLHHAAFDSFIIGVAPDYSVHVRRDVLEESDGPVLRYGLQLLHGGVLALPKANGQWPDPEALAWRFERFKKAA